MDALTTFEQRAIAYFESLPDYSEPTTAPKCVVYAEDCCHDAYIKTFWCYPSRAELEMLEDVFDWIKVLKVGGNPFPVRYNKRGLSTITYDRLGGGQGKLQVPKDVALTNVSQINNASIRNNAHTSRRFMLDWTEEYRNGSSGTYYTGGENGKTDTRPDRSVNKPPPFVKVRDYSFDAEAREDNSGQVVRKLADRTIVPKKK